MLLPELEEEAISSCVDSNLIKKVNFRTGTQFSLVSPDDQGHSLLSLMFWSLKLPTVQRSCQSHTLKKVYSRRVLKGNQIMVHLEMSQPSGTSKNEEVH